MLAITNQPSSAFTGLLPDPLGQGDANHRVLTPWNYLVVRAQLIGRCFFAVTTEVACRGLPYQ